MIYPQKLSSKKGDKIIRIFVIATIVIALFLLGLNRIIAPEIHWSAVCVAGMLYAWVVVYYSIKKSTNLAGHVLIQIIAISILTVFIDYEIGEIGWSINIIIPILILIANITMFVLTIVTHNKYINYAIYQLIIVCISMFPLILIYEHILQVKWISIVAIIVSIINLLVSVMLCSKDLKEVLVRKFHM